MSEDFVNQYERDRFKAQERHEQRNREFRKLLDLAAEDTITYWRYAEAKGYFRIEAETPEQLKHWARLTTLTPLLAHALDGRTRREPLYWGMEDAVTVALNALEDVNMHTERAELAEKFKHYTRTYDKGIRFTDLTGRLGEQS